MICISYYGYPGIKFQLPVYSFCRKKWCLGINLGLEGSVDPIPPPEGLEEAGRKVTLCVWVSPGVFFPTFALRKKARGKSW